VYKMSIDPHDPYEKERNAEYAEHNRMAIRALPCLVCGYALFWRFSTPLIESARDVLIVLGVHLLVELCYGIIKKDNWVFTISVFFAWSWLIYEWWFIESVNFLSAFGPSLALLFTTTCLIAFYDFYRKIKYENT
jgi:hypothetical protein